MALTSLSLFIHEAARQLRAGYKTTAQAAIPDLWFGDQQRFELCFWDDTNGVITHDPASESIYLGIGTPGSTVAAVCTQWDTITNDAISITTIITGVSGVGTGTGGKNEVQRITLPRYAIGGYYSVGISASGVLDYTDPLAYNASAATIQSALEELRSVTEGDVEVTKDGRAIDIVFKGTLDESDVTVATAQDLLTYGAWVVGTLDLNTTEVETLLGTAQTRGARLEVRIDDVSGNVGRVLQAPVTIRAQVVDATGVGPSSANNYYTKAQADARYGIRTVFTGQTVGNTVATLMLNGSAFVVSDNQHGYIKNVVAYYNAGSGAYSIQTIETLYERGSGAGTVSVGNMTLGLPATIGGASVCVYANTSSGTVECVVTGVTGQTISYSSLVDYITVP